MRMATAGGPGQALAARRPADLGRYRYLSPPRENRDSRYTVASVAATTSGTRSGSVSTRRAGSGISSVTNSTGSRVGSYRNTRLHVGPCSRITVPPPPEVTFTEPGSDASATCGASVNPVRTAEA